MESAQLSGFHASVTERPARSIGTLYAIQVGSAIVLSAVSYLGAYEVFQAHRSAAGVQLIDWLNGIVAQLGLAAARIGSHLVLTALIAAVLAGFAAICGALAGPIQGKRLRLAQVARETLFGLLWLWSLSISTVLIGALIGTGLTRYYFRVEQYGVAYLLFSVVLAIVGWDAYFYFTHRLLHRDWFYRNFHAVHHLSTRPDVMTQFQVAPVEQLILAGYTAILICVIPLHPCAQLTYATVSTVKSYLAHSGWEVFPAGTLRSRWWRFNTPVVHHDLHHQEYRYNFAFFFTWWDRWLGTESPRLRSEFERAKGCGTVSPVRQVSSRAGVGS